MWVDDIVVTANSKQSIDNFKQLMKEKFQMKDLGKISYFLGIQFKQKEHSITMSQSHYLKIVLKRYTMEEGKPRATPCEAKLEAYESGDDDTNQQNDVRKYREIVGSLVYAMTCSRPDLTWIITKLSQRLAAPTATDWMTIGTCTQIY